MKPIASFFEGVEKLIHAVFGDLTPAGKFWAYVALIGTCFAMYMSFDFGRQTSIVHGGMLAIITVCAGLGWHEAHKRFEKGAYLTCLFAVIACVPLQTFEFVTHSGYAAGFRGENVTLTRVQNAKYDGEQQAVAEDASNLAMWKKQLADLTSQNSWATTVKASALRDQVAVAQKEIELEQARGGCKAKCAIRMKEKADLEQKIGTIEQAADLTSRIEATQRVLDKKREKAATIDKVSSAVEHADDFLAQAIGFVQSGKLEATAEREGKAHFGLNIAMALTTTVGVAFAALMTGMNRSKEDAPATSFKPIGKGVALKPTPASPAAVQQPREIFRILDARSACLELRDRSLCA